MLTDEIENNVRSGVVSAMRTYQATLNDTAQYLENSSSAEIKDRIEALQVAHQTAMTIAACLDSLGAELAKFVQLVK